MIQKCDDRMLGPIDFLFQGSSIMEWTTTIFSANPQILSSQGHT